MSQTDHKPRCNFCLKELARRKDVTLHIQNTPRCRQQWEELLVSSQQKRTPYEQRDNTPGPTTHPEYEYEIPEDLTYQFPPRAEYEPAEAERSKRARVEEVADAEQPERFAKVFPHPAAEVLGVGKTSFEEIREDQINMGLEGNPWAPFCDEEEWGLAEWLAKRVNQTATDEFLKLAIVSHLQQLFEPSLVTQPPRPKNALSPALQVITPSARSLTSCRKDLDGCVT